jgi:hypothetical protein
MLWRDNDLPNAAQFVWHRHVVVDPSHKYDGVSLLQGPLGSRPGNFELVATRQRELVHLWREAGTKQWFGPFVIPIE